jgi:FkbM family methyltransferase
MQNFKARKKREAEEKRRKHIFFDVGASNGVKCLKWAKNYPQATVFAFEPLPKLFKELEAKARQYPNLHVFNFAISDKNKTGVSFYVSNDINCSSLHPFVRENIKKWKPPPGRGNFKTKSVIEVTTKRLDTFMKEHGIKVVDFIKIDTQGHDLAVVKSLGSDLERVKEICLEVQIVNFELYKGAATKDQVEEFMGKNKFEVFVTRSWSRNQEENIWFINRKYDRRKDNRFFHLNYADKY